MDANTQEVANRIKALREDMGLSAQEMADATGRSLAEYEAQESGREDLSYTFMSKCADAMGLDVVDILTGESPHLTGYSLERSHEGLSIKRHEGFEYLHKASRFKNRMAEPFLVTAPYLEEEQDLPIHCSRHAGQEIDYVLTGKLRFRYRDHVEEVGPGDLLYYDSGNDHGMIAIGGEPCTFLAFVLKPQVKAVEVR